MQRCVLLTSGTKLRLPVGGNGRKPSCASRSPQCSCLFKACVPTPCYRYPFHAFNQHARAPCTLFGPQRPGRAPTHSATGRHACVKVWPPSREVYSVMPRGNWLVLRGLRRRQAGAHKGHAVGTQPKRHECGVWAQATYSGRQGRTAAQGRDAVPRPRFRACPNSWDLYGLAIASAPILGRDCHAVWICDAARSCRRPPRPVHGRPCPPACNRNSPAHVPAPLPPPPHLPSGLTGQLLATARYMERPMTSNMLPQRTCCRMLANQSVDAT